jgi:hypothetical protein
MTRDKAENPAFNPQRVARAFGVAAATCALPLLTSCARVNIDQDGPFKVDIGSTTEKIADSRGTGSIGNAEIFVGFGDSYQTSETSKPNQPPQVIFSYPKKLESPSKVTVAVMAPNREQPVQLDVYPNGTFSANLLVVVGGTPRIHINKNNTCPNFDVSPEPGVANALEGLGVPSIVSVLLGSYNLEEILSNSLIKIDMIKHGEAVEARTYIVTCYGDPAAFDNPTKVTVIGLRDNGRSEESFSKRFLGIGLQPLLTLGSPTR